MQKIDSNVNPKPAASATTKMAHDPSRSSLIAGAQALPALAGKQELLARLKGVAVRIANAVTGRSAPHAEGIREAVAFEVPSARTDQPSPTPSPGGISGIDDRVAYLAIVAATPVPTLRSRQLGKQSLLPAAASTTRVECGRRCRTPSLCREACALNREKF